MTTTNTVTINEIPVSPTDQTKTAWGPALADQYFFVLANGTNANEEFDPASISAATQTRMAQYGRGISVVMGGGDDIATGSAFGDVFNAGTGVNRIDGGTNTGTAPDGSKARDVLNVFVASSAAVAALQVAELQAGATGADGDAYAAGYRIKVSNGTETDYLKNVEQINVFRADQNNAYVKSIMLAVDVREIAAGPGVADAMHFAWAQGTDRADSFDAQADVSDATKALMDQHDRGVYVDTGAGNDTVVGSGYGDDITLGSGTNYADGGANTGSTPWGGKPQDVLHVVVANSTAAAAVQVVQLGAGMSGVDAQAFANGYTHKVIAGSEIDYIKGIERVSVEIAKAGGGTSFARDIALETVVHEANLSDPNLGDYMHLAWVNGTGGNDTISAAADSGLLSAAVKAKMAEGQQGVWIDGGSGNDTITGSAYGDNIRNGSGNAKIDGGANAGGMDVFEISVASLAEMNAVQVAPSDDPAYTWMVSYGAGTQKDYLKNVEAIAVNVTGTASGKWIPLTVQVHEIAADNDPASSMHHAWAQGTDRADSFDAQADVSDATKALMAQHGRGVYADMGAGNDTVVGSGYGDDITLGSGTNYADGGANAGSTPWGGKPQDVLHVVVANATAAAAVQVVQLGAGLSGVDAEAFASGYTHKVVAGSEIDYIKGIERVSVEIARTGGGTSFVRDIALETVVHEANLLDPNLAKNMHLAWVNGTAGDDTINAGDLLSAGVKTKADELQKGVWIDGGSGNDTITGTAYGDNIRNGNGNAKIDGGANAGGMDVFEISVASLAEMNAVQVAASDDPAYSFMVTYGNGQKDYLKNIEAITVNVTGSTAGKWIPLAVQLNEIAADANHANAIHFAWARGTDSADSFDAATVSSATKALMAQHGRGIYADMGAGNDTVVGSGYGDHIILGSGTNYADGGANAGTTPSGGKAADVLQVVVASQAAADAVQVQALAAGMSGADAQAFANGYTYKVVAGSEIDYIKGFERVSVVMAGTNGSTWVRDVALAVQVQEAAASDPNIGGYSHLAWVKGTSGADSIDAGAGSGLLSDAVTQQMATRGKGVHIDGGDGNDTIIGSAYGDLIRNGAGSAKVDGGANTGGRDVFEVVVASTTALNAVKVEVSDDPAYAFMVSYGTGQKDYLKNVEAVSVRVEGGSAGKWIPLTVEVHEIPGQNTGGVMHVAMVQGTIGNDSFDAAADMSAATKALMTQYSRGVHIDMGVGNDSVVATAYGDIIVGGAGVNHIDGGANLGTTPTGSAANDRLDMYVASQAQADAVAVTVLSAASTGADLAAFNNGYRFKVANGTAEINYLKNVEHVNVMVWNDKDGDGQRDGLPASDPANEITTARGISLVANSAPTFAGVPAGVAIDGAGVDSVQTGGTVLADGKLLSARSLLLADGSQGFYLVRHNADGSIDTSFGSGSGRVALPTEGVIGNPSPVELADGKILVAVSTPGSNFDFKVMRLNADGSLDTTYGSNGAARIDFGTGSELPLELLLQPDGKLVVAGSGSVGVEPTSIVAARLNPDGSLDTGFGSGGKLQFAVPNASSDMTTLGLQADGKLLVGGYVVGAAGNPDAVVLRYKTDGTLDTSFGNGGRFMLAIGVATDNVRSVAVLPDGKILVGGTFRPTANDVDGFLLRLNSNGTLDTSFGSAGIAKPHFTNNADVFGYIAVQPDGKIIAYGAVDMSTSSVTGGGGDLLVARYLANGQPDTTFGNGGSMRVPGYGIGIGMDPAGLKLVDGKIVIFGSTMTDLANEYSQAVIARINADGTLDTSFNPAPLPSVGGSVKGDGIRPVALDANAAIYDADLQARGNYANATLKLARQGGASADDLFSALGEVSFANGQLSVAGIMIGTVTQAGGSLTLRFNTAATQGMVNRAMHGIGYSNASATAPDTVSIDWTFSDGNTGNQGFGGALSAVATSQVLIGTTVREIARSADTPASSTDGQPLSNYPFLAYVNGTARGETFDSNTQLSAPVRALMAELGRGARFDLGAGDDTLVGTGGSDEIYAGSGTNRIDGGANAGSYPFGGGAGRDTLHVLVADQAAANAVAVTMLAPGMTGADAEAFAAGYEVKVVNGSEIDYVKNVEMIKIFRWADTNGNKSVEGNELTWMREIPVALRVYETAISTTDSTKATDGRKLADIWHLASAEGWQRNDSFDATTDVSSTARQLMAQQGRGVWVDGGAGDDTLAGSAYGDNFIGGAGTNYIDGRANGGSTPNGQRPEDVLEIYVDTQARANAVQALALDASATGKDAEAFAAGYTWKVVDGAAVNYVKNVEAVNIFIWTDADGDQQRDLGEAPHARHIRLSASVSEVSRHATDPTKDVNGNPLSGYAHLAWVNGSAGGDSFNAATDITTATRSLMDLHQRGVYVDTFGGNDTVTGSAYGDNFITGAGINRIDGGDNRGTAPHGVGALDILEIYAADQAAAAAVAVTALTPGMGGADGDAYAQGYRFKVANGTVSTDYIKNVEQLSIYVWNDKDGDGQRDWGNSESDPAREITFVRHEGLVANTAPSFAGAPRGAMVRDGGGDYGYTGGVVLADGKLMSLAYLADGNNSYRLVFERSNPDGSIDTSFGNGSGRVVLDTAYGPAIQPVLLASGKLLVAHQTVPGNVMEILRVNQDGSIDTTFGSNGATVLGFGTTRAAPYQVIEAGDKLWVVGYAGATLQTVVARLNADGSLDTGFSGDGMLTLTVGTGSAEVPRAAAVQPDGKLVIVGYAQGSFNQDAVALRLNPDGSYDTSFGTGGKVFLRAGQGIDAIDTGTSMALLPNGQILVGGYVNSTTNNTSPNDGMLMRLNANGSLDTGFGSGGIVRVPGTANNDYVFRVAAQDDGSVLTLGISGGFTATNGDVTIARFRPDGSLDTAFGSAGVVRFAGRGMGSDYASLVVKDGKILVFGAVNDNVQGSASALILRLNADGSFDESFGAGFSSLGGITRADGYHWTALDTNAAIFDAELAARGNYGGATLAIERAGAASADDMYQGVGEVSFANGQLAVGGTVVGTVTQQGGRLAIVFNNNASQELVNRALHGIGYANANPAASSVTLNWQFSDGNTGSQGVGSALGAGGSTTVEIGVVLQQTVASASDASRTTKGEIISQLSHLASVNGSGAADTVDGATAFQPQTSALMTTHQKGARFDMGAGDDRVTGTAYGDEFVMGQGINRVDGAAGNDVLKVVVADQAAAEAVTVTQLDAGMTGADGEAYTQGYRVKVVNGDETDYVRNVEQIQVVLWQDKDGDRVRDDVAGAADEVTVARTVSLVPNSAPSFAGLPAGVIARDPAYDATTMSGTVLRDGKLMAVNYVADADEVYRLVLERSNPDGNLDASFGNGSGRVAIDVALGWTNYPIELPDGKLLITTQTSDGPLILQRLLADGSKDLSFGNGGAVQLSVAGAKLTSLHEMLGADGKLTLIGGALAPNGGGYDMLAMRLNVDGSLDTSFAGTGQLRLAVPTTHELMRAGALQTDGKLVIAGYAQGTTNQDIVAMRFNVDGSPDTTFGNGGTVTLKPGIGVDGVDSASNLLVLPNGKILIAGNTTAPASGSTLGKNDAVLMRLNADGSLDTGFGTGGIVRAPATANHEYIHDMALLEDGSIVTMGMSSPTTTSANSVLTLSRFRPDGSLDTSFGYGGEVRLDLRGAGSQGSDLAIVNGKIVVMGTVYNNAEFYSSPMLVRLNLDGSLDSSFVLPGATSLGNTVRADGRYFKAIDHNVSIFDAELAALGNYHGASVSVARQGGAQAEDLFAGVGDVSFANGRVTVGGTDIGGVVNGNGQLVLTFNNAATQVLVNRAIQNIGYANASTTPPASVTFGWTFADGNTGGQGLGTSLSATGTSTVEFGLLKTETRAMAGDPSRTDYGQQMSQVQWMATVTGSARAETFDAATDVGSATRDLMSTWGRGAVFDMGGGGDTVTGTGSSDEFVMGQGVNRVDGGLNAGTHPHGGAGKDQLMVYVANQAQADAVKVIKLDAGMSGADGDAFAAGYEAKVVNGAEIDYIKNVERVVVSLWNDADGDRVREGNEITYVRDVPLQLRVFTVSVGSQTGTDAGGHPLAEYAHFAWLESWTRNDSVNVAIDVPEATRALMDQYGRGVFIDTGSGDDTIVASGYGDNIVAGAGTNRIDGGANAGTPHHGGKAEDFLEVHVGTAQEANAARVTALTAGMGGADGAAYADGYRWKLVAGQETDYIKNIEAINVSVWNDVNGNGHRDNGETQHARQFALEARINEVRVSQTDATKDYDGAPLADKHHFAWAYGTAGDDVIDAASISQPTRTLMQQVGRGVWGTMGDGNDRVTGSAQGDNFDLGKGVNRFDGGTNLGARPDGSPAFDVLEVHVRSQAEADAVTVVKLAAGMTGDDAAAFAEGYQYKVSAPDQVSYIRNVEQVYVGIWNDLDGDGEIDHGTEATFNRMIDVEQNTAPRFGAPQGIAVVDHGWDFTPSGLHVRADGKLVSLAFMDQADSGYNYIAALTRHNRDGSVDTSFGNGKGYLLLPTTFSTGGEMGVQADGKIVVAYPITTTGAAGLKVVRYNTDGSVDTTFGSNGERMIGFDSGPFNARAVLIGANGTISVAGSLVAGVSNQDFAVVRLTANGSLDTSFNGSGKMSVALTPKSDILRDAQLQADGKLVLAGSTDSSAQDFAVVRVNVDGTLDSGFGSNGQVILPVGSGHDTATSLALLADGSMVVAGHSQGTSNLNGAIVKLNADGTLATGFGSGGMITAPADTTLDRNHAMLVQPDGKIVVAGESGATQQLAVTRYNADGSLDTGFGNGGRVLMTLRGMRDYATAMAMDGDKIVLQIPSYFNMNADSSQLLARLNADGSLDTSFAPGQPDTLGSTVRTDGLHPVVLDHNAMVYDAELAARGHYEGASLTVERQGGPNAEDVFSLVGDVSAGDGRLYVGGTWIGSVSNSAGTLHIEFNSSATQALVNRALHGIAYVNQSATPPASVSIGWRFGDGNEHNAQGGGGERWVDGSTTVQIAPVAREVMRSYLDAQKDVDGRSLSGIDFFASVTGTKGSDGFDAADLSPQVRALMAEFGRGATYQMIGGSDIVVGTGYSDEFIMGKGINWVDGGANAGTSPYGDGKGPGRDMLIVYVPDQAAAGAVTTDMLTPLSSGADAAAYAQGYEAKIVSGDQVNYVRNVEAVSVHTWTDTNGNGIVDGVEGKWLHDIQFRARVDGVRVSTEDSTKDTDGKVLAQQWHFAWAHGTKGDDWVIVEQQVGNGVLEVMNQHGRGAWVNLGDGDDVVAATNWGDNINVGKGLNWVNGGTNTGTTPDGNPASDVLEVNVASLAERNAVTWQVLKADATGEDGRAYAEGFRFKVVAPNETDYLVNVEQLSVSVWNDLNGDGQRDYNTEVSDVVWVNLDPNAEGVIVVGTPQS